MSPPQQSNLTSILIFWMTASLLSQTETGSLSTGTFLAFTTAFASFITGVTTLSNTLIDMLEIGVLWSHAKPIVDELPEVDLNKADPGRLSGYIKLDHVTFRYREDGPLNLDDVTIEAKPGEFIAFVGSSGSGKCALVLKPRIIFFDEATSALDNRTQAIVSESLERLKVTRIAIAHRLSTIRNADRIYVIEAGRVVQQGSFEELANQEGLFAKLMVKQGKGKKGS